MKGLSHSGFYLEVGRKPVPRVVRQVLESLPLNRETTLIEIVESVEELRGHTLTGAVVAQISLMYADGGYAILQQKHTGRILAVTRTR